MNLKCILICAVGLGWTIGCASSSQQKRQTPTIQEQAYRETIARFQADLKTQEEAADQQKNSLLHALISERDTQFKVFQNAQESCRRAGDKLLAFISNLPQAAVSLPLSPELAGEISKQEEALKGYGQRLDEQTRQVYVKAFAGLSTEIKNDILNQRVRVGMTAQQAELAWGKPWQTKVLSNQPPVTEQWIYSGRNCLYFEDGKLTSFELGR